MSFFLTREYILHQACFRMYVDHKAMTLTFDSSDLKQKNLAKGIVERPLLIRHTTLKDIHNMYERRESEQLGQLPCLVIVYSAIEGPSDQLNTEKINGCENIVQRLIQLSNVLAERGSSVFGETTMTDSGEQMQTLFRPVTRDNKQWGCSVSQMEAAAPPMTNEQRRAHLAALQNFQNSS